MPHHVTFHEDDDDDDTTVESKVPSSVSSLEVEKLDDEGAGDDESDDDAPPDHVSFSAGKTAALLDAKAIAQAANMIRQQTRDKGRQREAFLTEQKLKKKIRLENLASQKLPEEVLVKVSHEPVVELTPSLIIEKTKRPSPIDLAERKAKRKAIKKESLSISVPDNILDKTEDFIPLNSKLTEFHVQVARKEGENVAGVVGKAESLIRLKNNLIFGSLKSRESPEQALAKKTKQAATGLSAFPVVCKRKYC